MNDSTPHYTVKQPHKHLGDVCPAVASGPVGSNKRQLLIVLPALLVDVRAQLMVPALAQLLANAAGEVWQQLAPAAWAIQAHLPAAPQTKSCIRPLVNELCHAQAHRTWQRCSQTF